MEDSEQCGAQAYQTYQGTFTSGLIEGTTYVTGYWPQPGYYLYTAPSVCPCCGRCRSCGQPSQPYAAPSWPPTYPFWQIPMGGTSLSASGLTPEALNEFLKDRGEECR